MVAIDAEWSLGCRDHQGRLRAGLWYGAVGPEPHILMTVTRSAGLNPPLLEVSVAGLLEVNPVMQHKVTTQGQDLELSLAWARRLSDSCLRPRSGAPECAGKAGECGLPGMGC